MKQHALLIANSAKDCVKPITLLLPVFLSRFGTDIRHGGSFHPLTMKRTSGSPLLVPYRYDFFTGIVQHTFKLTILSLSLSLLSLLSSEVGLTFIGRVNRLLKPPILSCFGVIAALAIGGKFEKYLTHPEDLDMESQPSGCMERVCRA